jgi:L-ascorbate metabolism protein UlaG (beta-lactamase superfamily)
MATALTWWGHGSWLLATGGQHVLLDPFLSDSPVAPVKAEAVSADYILLSHGHFDHVADAATIAQRTGATIVANFEITEWFRQQHRLERTVAMNIGGGVQLPFGHVKMTPAWHSSQLPDGSYGGTAAGFVVKLNDYRIYFACDTSHFGDMQLIGDQGIDLAVLPIGDLFTMGPEDSLQAIRMIRPTRVVPSHFNTWPPIAQNAVRWAEAVRASTEAEPIVLAPGESLALAN